MIFKAGLNPAHLHNTKRFAQNVSPEGPESNKDKTANCGKNQHETAGHGVTLK